MCTRGGAHGTAAAARHEAQHPAARPPPPASSLTLRSASASRWPWRGRYLNVSTRARGGRASRRWPWPFRRRRRHEAQQRQLAPASAPPPPPALSLLRVPHPLRALKTKAPATARRRVGRRRSPGGRGGRRECELEDENGARPRPGFDVRWNSNASTPHAEGRPSKRGTHDRLRGRRRRVVVLLWRDGRCSAMGPPPWTIGDLAETASSSECPGPASSTAAANRCRRGVVLLWRNRRRSVMGPPPRTEI